MRVARVCHVWRTTFPMKARRRRQQAPRGVPTSSMFGVSFHWPASHRAGLVVIGRLAHYARLIVRDNTLMWPTLFAPSCFSRSRHSIFPNEQRKNDADACQRDCCLFHIATSIYSRVTAVWRRGHRHQVSARSSHGPRMVLAWSRRARGPNNHPCRRGMEMARSLPANVYSLNPSCHTSDCRSDCD